VNLLLATGTALTAAPVVLFAYAYIGYPALLRMLAAMSPAHRKVGAVNAPDPDTWPYLTITVPAYNEENRIAAALDGVLRLDYPEDRRQILVISDASTDRTDEIVTMFAERGVQLVRLPARRGKSAAENAAAAHAYGEIIVNIDASVIVPPHSLKALVRAFRDPGVGLASGRDVSVAVNATSIGGESGYVGYEMRLRALETRIDSIVGASGCFYAIRRPLYDPTFPEDLSRDFGSALMVRRQGYRAVSADEALCLVPRSTGLRSELRRKVRTMARGLATLWHMRSLMNVRRYGTYAFMLISHKLVRWLVYLALPGILVGLTLLSLTLPMARPALALALLGIASGALALAWPNGRPLPRLLNAAGFALASALAGVLAWVKVMRRERLAVWEPTRRAA
jgi:cellulose synthase/poly-beta-1,6-N-acetylglucosamine synthase-like glycosyltransferase